MALFWMTCIAYLLALEPPRTSTGTELDIAIETFNQQATEDPIGAQQPPLTHEEVVAAIRFWDRDDHPEVSDAMVARFKHIAVSNRMPASAAFETITAFDPGGDFVFDTWSVRIRIKRPNGSSYAFVIRERVLASRTLAEELDRLQAFLSDNGIERMVGGHRYRERVESLQSRIGSPD